MKKHLTLSEAFIDEAYSSGRKKRNVKTRIKDTASKAGKSIGSFAKKVFWDDDDHTSNGR